MVERAGEAGAGVEVLEGPVSEVLMDPEVEARLWDELPLSSADGWAEAVSPRRAGEEEALWPGLVMGVEILVER